MKYIIQIILFVFLLIGCASEKNGQSHNQEPDRPGLIDDFIIIAYSGPPPEETTLERFLEIAESGIEYLATGGSGDFSVEQNLKAMDLAYEAGIGMIPWDIRTLPYTANQDITIDTAALAGIVNDYQDHPALVAYMIMDEPYAHLFPELDTITRLFRKLDPDHKPLINVNPSYGWVGDDFRDYIRSYIKTVKPALLSYDHYVFRHDTIIPEPWFSDLAIIREEARRANIPYLVFVFSEGITQGMKQPNRAEILWQANTALAYGTRGIGWFCYWTPLPDQGWSIVNPNQPIQVVEHYGAMIDINGNRTRVYDDVKEVNQFLKKAGKGLLGWNNQEAARFEAGNLIEGSSSVLIPEGDHANLVIGTYLKDEKVRVVISNSSWEKPATFSLKILSEWKLDGIFTSIDAVPTEGSLTEWTMEPGGSVVIELK